MSLRTKFMLALLLTGLAAVAMVGGLAYVGMTKKVDIIRREQAAEHFYTAVSGYLHTYGSWQAAIAVEPFDNYMRRYQDLRGDRRPPPGEQGPEGGRGPDQGPDQRPRPGPGGEPEADGPPDANARLPQAPPPGQAPPVGRRPPPIRSTTEPA